MLLPPQPLSFSAAPGRVYGLPKLLSLEKAGKTRKAMAVLPAKSEPECLLLKERATKPAPG